MTSKPNIIVFFTDQQRWDTAGIHGNPLDLTPNFDHLARAGTDAHHSYTCQPVCGPARACLQTGLYATETGCFRNGIPLSPDRKTLAHHFNEAGYDTAYIGKWHLADGEHGPVAPAQRGGYDYWLASNLLEFTSDAYDMVMYDGDGQARKLPGYRVDAQTDAAIRYIDSHQEDPFFSFSCLSLNRIIRIIATIIRRRWDMPSAIGVAGFRRIWRRSGDRRRGSWRATWA